MGNRVSQIAGIFQKNIFESCTMYHIMPFAKIRVSIKKGVKVNFSQFMDTTVSL